MPSESPETAAFQEAARVEDRPPLVERGDDDDFPAARREIRQRRHSSRDA